MYFNRIALVNSTFCVLNKGGKLAINMKRITNPVVKCLRSRHIDHIYLERATERMMKERRAAGHPRRVGDVYPKVLKKSVFMFMYIEMRFQAHGFKYWFKCSTLGSYSNSGKLLIIMV